MVGVKRIRTNNDSSKKDSKTIAPPDYSFNFIPTLKPSQKLFDVDNTTAETNIRPEPYSANTLTLRFNKRLEKRKEIEKRIERIPKQVVHSSTVYEPMYQRHQYISYTIITYIQMTFNIVITITILYLFTKIILVVKQDFRLKAQEHFDVLHQEKELCTRNYMLNHCGKEDRVPAVETMCMEWASCMQKDIVVAQAKVSAETIADIINSFVEPFSYKTLLFLTLLIIGSLVFSNVSSRLFMRKYVGPNAI
ncbi:Di-sulfide bridge nucleocytoplasmic transport domain-containing protein [Pilaira anomala]|nr:Di-sulfide bridge nucleocytoplasmic transport domain-containing protein [Pilaira anomala]